MSPFELDVGQHPITPHSILKLNREIPSVEDFVEEQQSRLIRAQDALQHAQSQQAKYYNEGRKEESFQLGDLVLVSTKHTNPPFMKTSGSKKLRPKFVGPWPVIRLVGKTACELELPQHMKIHPVINTQYLKKFIASPDEFAGRTEKPPPPMQIVENEAPEYEVEGIKGHRKDKRGRISYLVAWKGYEDHDMTWEPAKNLTNARGIVEEYWKTCEQQL
jgi:hypothetical protein